MSVNWLMFADIFAIIQSESRGVCMDSRTYYYARVSSKEQNLDRQIAAFKALGASERDIITDKESSNET